MFNNSFLVERFKHKKRTNVSAMLLLLGIVSFVTLLSLIASHWYSMQAIKFVKVSGNAMLTASDISSIINVNIMDIPANGINLALLRNKLLFNEFITDANVWFNSRGVLGIEIKERVPIGINIDNSGALSFVDEVGSIFAYRPFKEYTDLPIITNANYTKKHNVALKGAVDIINTLQSVPMLYNIVSEISFDANSMTYSLILTEDEIVVDFGNNENIAEKLNNLNIFWKNVIMNSTNKKSLKQIDAKWKNTIIVKT